jgi:hypothetical protein
MRRREFIAFLGSSLAGCPLAARAQQRERMRRIGTINYTPMWEPLRESLPAIRCNQASACISGSAREPGGGTGES